MNMSTDRVVIWHLRMSDTSCVISGEIRRKRGIELARLQTSRHPCTGKMNGRRFTAAQVRILGDTLLHLYDEVEDSDPLERIVDAISRVVPACWISVDEL